MGPIVTLIIGDAAKGPHQAHDVAIVKSWKALIQALELSDLVLQDDNVG